MHVRRLSSHLESLELRTMLDGAGLPLESGDESVWSGPGEPAHHEWQILIEGEQDLFGDSVHDAVKLPMDRGAFGAAEARIHAEIDVDVYAIPLLGPTVFVDVLPHTPGLVLQATVRTSDGIDIAKAHGGVVEEVPEGETGHGHGIATPFSLAFDVELDADTGPIFLIVESIGESTGDYALQVHIPIEVEGGDSGGNGGGGASSADAEFGNDIHADSIDSAATQLSFDNDFAQVISHIDRDADTDAFRFTAEKNSLIVEAFGDLPIVLRMYDAEGRLVDGVLEMVEDPDAPELFHPSIGSFETEPGQEYFVTVGSSKGRVGRYEMLFSSFDRREPLPPDSSLGDDVHGDTPATATRLDLASDNVANVFTHWDAVGDVDVFSLVANGTEVFLDLQSLDDELLMSLKLLDADGADVELQLNGFGVVGEPVEQGDFVFAEGMFSAVPGASYFLTVAGTGNPGPYRLHVFSPEVITVDPETPVDPVGPVPHVDADSPLGIDLHMATLDTDATSLSFNDEGFIEVHSNVDHEGDFDAFRIVGTGESIVGEVGGFGLTDMRFQVFHEDGRLVTAAAAWGVLEFASNVNDVYFITAHSEAGVGQYLVALQSLPLPIDPTDPTDPTDLESTDPDADPDLEVDDEAGKGSSPEVGDETDLRNSLADINGDHLVDFADFLVLSSNFGRETDVVFADGDLNADDVIDFVDFLILSASIGVND